MPIRRATEATAPNSEAGNWVISLVTIGVLVGFAVAYGDRNASSVPPLDLQPIQVPTFPPPIIIDPATFEALEQLQQMQLDAPLAVVPLQHEVHVSQIANGDLFVTGLITASDASAVEDVTLEITARDLGGAPVSIPRAVISCKTMQPGERCAWMIDTEVPGAIVELEFSASGRRSLQIGPPQLDLRSEREGELDFNPKQRTVKFVTRDHTLREAWATVTAYSSEQRVLGVAETRFAGRHRPGRQRFDVAVPRPPDEVGHYEVRVGGELLD
jgi:hypothetical protein